MTFEKNRRQILLNQAPPLRVDDYLCDTQVVAFTPEDLQLVRGAPDLRRRFLDRAVFHTDLSYLSEVRNYLRVLKHRNALLRAESRNADVLAVLDEQFIAWAARILRRRIFLLQRLRPYMQRAFQRIFPETDWVVDMEYQSPIGNFSPSSPTVSVSHIETELQERLRQQLQRHRSREIERRSTLLGPHLDDIEFTFQERPFKTAASQGQTRGLVLALKVAEIFDIQHRSQQHPILILDDVAGELDAHHSAFLFAFLEETPGQVLLSATHRNQIQLANLDQYPHRVLQAGRIV